uniref:Uncharacterized protein n=1 Tax=Hanusia phi TaxID=3032 RepID=A0A7S0HJB0_9CRYP|mmetsp:Transcript_28342/g.64219  ORF Transcript_28342/g.64219 Transcript_28342/m.64219 type:complete len:335 (+) Transcript_28342:22-1026(+)
MAATPMNPPSQSQFFGALAVAALVLVCTAVVMTERPVWMVGQEPPLGILRPFTAPAPSEPVYTAAQLREMATAGLSESAATKSIKLQSLAEHESDEKEAIEEAEEKASAAASQKEAKFAHVDDEYAQVENAPGPLYPPTHGGQDLDVLQFGDYPADYGSHTSERLQKQDTIVPVNMVQMSMYPIIGPAGMQDAAGLNDHETGTPGKPITANLLFGKTLRTNGLGDGVYVETVAGGLGANSEPPIDRMFDQLTSDKDGEDDGTLSTVLLWTAVLVVLIGGIVLIGYNLLPAGSFSRAWRGDDGLDPDNMEAGKWTRATYEPPVQGLGYTTPMQSM